MKTCISAADQMKKSAFGYAVEAARLELGLSQEQLERIARLPLGTIRRVELLGATPRSKCFQPLCAELGLNPLSEDFQ